MTLHVPEILLAENDERLAEHIIRQMESAGYRMRRTATIVDTLNSCRDWHPDVIVFDWTLMDQGDLPTLRSLQEASLAPVLLLVPRGWELDWCELGANDCMTKPFSWKELLGRTRALLRAQNRSDYQSS
ncbi:MAG: response regulator transcription factor [Ktedonobacterales bacterium]